MKKLITILMIISIAFSNVSCSLINIAETKGVREYNEDYIKKYESTFNVMFENNWRIIAVENKYEDHDEVCEHVDTRPQKFIEWTIEYYDGNGELCTFVFDNRSSLSGQIERYVTEYIADFYKKNYFDVRFKDLPLAPSSYVFGFLAKISVNRDKEENKEQGDQMSTLKNWILLKEQFVFQDSPQQMFLKCVPYICRSMFR